MLQAAPILRLLIFLRRWSRLGSRAIVDEVLHLRRAVLHRREMRRHRVRRRVMGSFRWMVRIVSLLLIRTAHVFGPTLVLGSALLIKTALLLEAATL